MIIINPRRASAAGVTVLGLWSGVSVCLLSHISPIERLFTLKTLSHTQRATKICGNLPETTAFKSYAANKYSDLAAVSFLSVKHQG